MLHVFQLGSGVAWLDSCSLQTYIPSQYLSTCSSGGWIEPPCSECGISVEFNIESGRTILAAVINLEVIFPNQLNQNAQITLIERTLNKSVLNYTLDFRSTTDEKINNPK